MGNSFTEAEITGIASHAMRVNIGQVHLFVVDTPISIFAQKLIGSELAQISDNWSLLNTPSDARRHGQCSLIGLPNIGEKGRYSLYYADEEEGSAPGSQKCAVGELERGSARFINLGWFTPSGPIIVDRKLQNSNAINAAIGIAMCAFVLSLINQPRLVKLPSLMSRPQRRAAQRGGHMAVDAMHRVTWDLDKEVAAKVSRDADFHKMPLHWRRGHYRKAMPHWSGAVQRKDAIRGSERDSWWQWIEGVWVGHPAFGTKLSIHAPKMSTSKFAAHA